MEYTHDSADSTIGFSAVTLTDETVTAFQVEIDRLDRAIRLAIDGGALTGRKPTKKPRKVVRCTFTDGEVVDVPLKKYEELELHLAAHTATLEEL